MSIGIVSLSTNAKKEQSGAPFASGAANNGLSVNAVTGKIVLGNDLADPAAPAALFSDREIETEDILANLFAVLLNAIRTGITTRLDGLSVVLNGADNTSPIISVISGLGGTSVVEANCGVGGFAIIRVGNGNDRGSISAETGGFVLSAGNPNPSPFMRTSTATFNTEIGPTLAGANGAALQVTGTLTYRTFTFGVGAGTSNIDRDLDSGKLWFNSAAANLALPNMAGSNSRPGFRLSANCASATGITITAATGQTIRFGSLATSSGGTLSSTDVGAFVTIVLINTSTWVTETFNGAWVLT